MVLHRRANDTIKEEFVTVYYPFHPYYGKTLPVSRIYSKNKSPAYVCKIAEHKTLLIPKWVTYPEAEIYKITKASQISFDCLLRLTEYLRTQNI